MRLWHTSVVALFCTGVTASPRRGSDDSTTRLQGSGPCSVDGIWNALGSGDSKAKLVNLSQPTGTDQVTGSFWLPSPANTLTGTLDSTHHLNFTNGLRAVATASTYPPGQDRDCTILTFSQGSVWCMVGFCPPGPPGPNPKPPPPPGPPTPYDPVTPMPQFDVPGAAAAGAFYPTGTPAYYYANMTGSTGWVIHLSGGGWRFVGESGAADDTVTSDGLPHNMGGGSCYGGCDGILSNNAAINPLFHSWNKVWVPISGTSFTGDVWDSSKGYIRGKRIQTVVIEDLLNSHGMKGATNVILTGGSSGGLAVYLTCDRVGEQIRATNSTTRYTCLADAGHFLHHDDMKGGNTTSESFKRSYYGWNSTGGTNQACVAAMTPTQEDWKCIFAQYVTPFIKSELYVMQNLYDSWQVNNILKIGCSGYNQPMTSCSSAQMAALEQYGADMRQALTPLTSNPRIGMFAPSCIAHCQSVENEHPIALWYWPTRWSIVENSTSLYPRDAFNSWYSGSSTGMPSKHVQDCAWSPDTCNKLCPDWT